MYLRPDSSPLSRRAFVRGLSTAGLASAGVAILSACGAPAAPTAAPKPTEAPKPAAAATTAPPATSAPAPTAAAATKPAAPTLAEAAKPSAAPTLAPASAATKPAGATPAAGAAGTSGLTLRMAFVPSSNSAKILSSGQPLGDMLGKMTGYKFEVSVPTSYAAVIEAMGSNKVDIGWLAPFAYVLAHDKYGAEVMLLTTRQGSRTYVSQIIAHADSGIKTIEDLKGKKFAFGDPSSASNYLYPAAFLKEKGYDPKSFFSEVVFAGGHDKVVIAVYNKQVDGGATFGRSSTDPNAPLTDARTIVKSTLPDVLDKVKIVAETDPIPNDTVSVRKGLEPPVVDKVKTALLQLSKQPDGAKLLTDLYQIDGLAEAKDSDFDPIRKKAQLIGVNIEQAVIPPAKPQAVGSPAATGSPPAAGSPAATPGAGTPAAKP